MRRGRGRCPRRSLRRRTSWWTTRRWTT
uniref:Uncharacterized protein n=1 Tax=Arundo donax TaxID=35708 RepID=A0A0A9GFS1_ARUDO